MLRKRTRRADWSQRLPRPQVIPDVMTLTTLADVRELVEHHVPAEVRERSTWQYLAQQPAEAAAGADPVHVSIVPRMVLGFEGLSAAPDEGDRPARATALGVSP
jgi:hypothetical protein